MKNLCYLFFLTGGSEGEKVKVFLTCEIPLNAGSLNGIIYNRRKHTWSCSSLTILPMQYWEHRTIHSGPSTANFYPEQWYHHTLKCLLAQDSRKAHIQSTFYFYSSVSIWQPCHGIFQHWMNLLTNAKRAALQVIKRQNILMDALE